MMLEEAPDAVLRDVVEDQRSTTTRPWLTPVKSEPLTTVRLWER